MPPKTRITKEMIIKAAFEVTRSVGIEKVNARTISEQLECSTQPVMYQFKKIVDIKKAVYEEADQAHSNYITTDLTSDNPMLEIGMRYIRFAADEKYLFQLLFQTNELRDKDLKQLILAPDLDPVIQILQTTEGLSRDRAEKVFTSVFLLTHGYASMFANNSMAFDEIEIVRALERAFIGALYASKDGICE